MPKRLRALRFRTVGPWLYLGPNRRKTGRAVVANPLRSYFHGALPTARMISRETWGLGGTRKGELGERETGSGVRDWQTPGDSRPRKGNGISRRARRRSRGCARTLFVSLQNSTGGFGSKKPFPHTYSLERGMGDAVDGCLAYG